LREAITLFLFFTLTGILKIKKRMEKIKYFP